METKLFKAYRVREDQKGNFSRKIEERKLDELPDGDILVKVHYAALNYKDALSFSGNKGVTRKYPHTPGIDGAGIIIKSNSSECKEGDKVIVTSHDLGMNTDGAMAEYIRIPKE